MNARVVKFSSGRAVSFSKFGNTKVVRDGLKFDSKREATRYEALKLLEGAGRIRNLKLQVKYEMRVNDVLICTYKADFVYDEYQHGKWLQVVEDSKGWPNDRWPMKKKLLKACHGIDVRET